MLNYYSNCIKKKSIGYAFFSNIVKKPNYTPPQKPSVNQPKNSLLVNKDGILNFKRNLTPKTNCKSTK